MIGSEPVVQDASADGQEAAPASERLPDEPRMVYVGNLAWGVTWQELKDHMKQAGTVEFARILTTDGYESGRSRGIAYVRYATEDEAKAAIASLNQSELNGRAISVDVWTGKKPGAAPKGGGKGFFGKGKGGYWMKGGMPYMYGMKGGMGKGFGKSIKMHGEFNQMVFVGNLPFKAEWQELKDHMKTAGSVEFVKILTEGGFDYGRSRGIACVRYSTEEAANEAIKTLNGSELMGRQLTVDKWTKSAAAAAAGDAAPAPEEKAE